METLRYMLRNAKEKIVERYSSPRSGIQLVDHPSGYGQIIVRAAKMKPSSVDFYSHKPLIASGRERTLAEEVAEIDACL